MDIAGGDKSGPCRGKEGIEVSVLCERFHETSHCVKGPVIDGRGCEVLRT